MEQPEAIGKCLLVDFRVASLKIIIYRRQSLRHSSRQSSFEPLLRSVSKPTSVSAMDEPGAAPPGGCYRNYGSRRSMAATISVAITTLVQRRGRIRSRRIRSRRSDVHGKAARPLRRIQMGVSPRNAIRPTASTTTQASGQSGQFTSGGYCPMSAFFRPNIFCFRSR